MSHRLLAGAAALALLASPAVAAAEVHEYQTIDAVETAAVQILGTYVMLAITGTLANGAAHTAQYVGYYGSTSSGQAEAIQGCQRMALMALSRPGRFTLRVTDTPSDQSQYTLLLRCKLVRND
jgi:hypothetical protein